MFIRKREIIFCIDAGIVACIDNRDANRDSGGKGAKLLQPFRALESVLRQRNPPQQGSSAVHVHSDMTSNEVRPQRDVFGRPQPWDGRPRKVERSAIVSHDNFYDIGCGQIALFTLDSSCTHFKCAVSDQRRGSADSLLRDEGLVTLHIDNCVEGTEFGCTRNLRDAIRAGRMAGRGENDPRAGCSAGFEHLTTVGGYNALVGEVQSHDPLPDADNDGLAGEEAKWLARKARGREASRNNRERRQRSNR